MKAMGGDAMDISSSEVPKNCCMCTKPVTNEYFDSCASCDNIAHSSCVRADDWICDKCSITIVEEEEEEEDKKCSEGNTNQEEEAGETYKLTAASPFGLCNAFRTVRPLGDQVLIKAKQEQTIDHLFYTKLQVGEVADIGKTILDFKIGEEVAFWTDAGTKLALNGITYILLGLDDILGFFESDYSKPGNPKCEDIRDLIPCADRVLVQIAEKDEQRAKGLIATSPIGTVVTISHDESEIQVGTPILYTKSGGHEIASANGRKYTIVQKSEILAIFSYKAVHSFP